MAAPGGEIEKIQMETKLILDIFSHPSFESTLKNDQRPN